MEQTTVEKVKLIIDTQLTDPNIEGLIASANVFMTSATEGYTMTDAEWANLQSWVTAHFIAVSKERQGQKEDAGTAAITYTGKYGANLNMTSYGQTALLLDPTGRLASAHKSKIQMLAVVEKYCYKSPEADCYE